MKTVPPEKFESLIQRCERYVRLSEEQKKQLSGIISWKEIPKDGFLVRAGENTQQVGFLLKGTIRYYYINEDGREFTRYFCQEGNFVSSYSSILKGVPSAYSIQALEDLDLIVFDMGDWQSLASRDPVWALITVKILEEAQLISEERERSLLLDDAPTRYLKLLEDYPEIEQKVRQYDLASYLGITPVALSRIRQRLKKNQISSQN